MELTRKLANVFVLGDIVLDHFIPATAKQGPFQAVGTERVFDGHSRRTIPGGAANCARLIAALGCGRVCLWGISGYSPWGSFADILRKFDLTDKADRSIIFHGSHNETHRMNTVTRLVSFEEDGIRHREFRVDDVDHFPATEGQQRDAIAYLQSEHKEHGIHAIILNDLNMGSLTNSLVQDVGEFAREAKIPIFVDPKRDWSKYRRIEVTCVLPNLSEWCHIVEDGNGEKQWRREVEEGRLERMANKCLRCLPNATFHLIKCDQLGVVFIAPSGTGHRIVRRIESHPPPADKLPGQLGAGDVLVAALAMQYAALANLSKDVDRMLKALESALAVTACYLQLDWQKAPTERDIKQFEFQKISVSSTTSIPESLLYLPKHEDVHLKKFSVLGSRLVSDDKAYCAKIQGLANFLLGGWDNREARSAIVTGRGGVGKTDLTEALGLILTDASVSVWGNFNPSQATCPSVDSALEQIISKTKELPAGTKGLLVVIDEAFSKAPHLLMRESGKMLLQGSAKCNPVVRFLLVDADLEGHRAELSDSQFLSRCEEYLLPALSSRRADIPYIFGAACLKHLNENSVKVSEAVLLGVVNWLLKMSEGQQSARNITEKAREITTNFTATNADPGHLAEISKRHLTSDLQEGLQETEPPRHFFQFSW